MVGEKYNMSLSARGALFPNNLVFLLSFLISYFQSPFSQANCVWRSSTSPHLTWACTKCDSPTSSAPRRSPSTSTWPTHPPSSSRYGTKSSICDRTECSSVACTAFPTPQVQTQLETGLERFVLSICCLVVCCFSSVQARLEGGGRLAPREGRS